MNEFNEKFGKNYHVGTAGLVINGIQPGSTEPIIIYTGLGVCKVAEDIIEYGEPKFNIDYYNNLNK